MILGNISNMWVMSQPQEFFSQKERDPQNYGNTTWSTKEWFGGSIISGYIPNMGLMPEWYDIYRFLKVGNPQDHGNN